MASKPEIADPPFKTTSPVWKYIGFRVIDGKVDDKQTKCRICHKIIPRPPGSSTSSMLGHIKTHHPDIDLSGELKKPHQQIGASTSNIEMEMMQGEKNAMQRSSKQHHGNATINEAEFSKVKDIMKDVHDKISQDTELNKFIKGRICDLEKSKMELVGVFGRTGAGKSSLINAIIGEKDLLPSGDASACTSVMIQVQANMTDSKYIAEIEFIPAKEWEEELWDFLKNRDPEKNEYGDTDDDDIKEKISALYGEEYDKKFAGVADFMDNKNFKEIPEFLQSKEKTLKCKSSSELSAKIEKYTRRDSENPGTRYWPLVKCVTIKVPNASKLLQHVALIDLPGTGDCNKSRDEMWKKFVGDCSAVWIVSGDTKRADSDKESWEILNQTISLIGNGGECRHIRFIYTHSDVIDDKYKTSKKEARDHVLQRNKRVKEQVQKKFDKEKRVIKKHFSGDSDFFQVFTVTSKDLNELKYLQKEDTEIPQLQQFVKDLNDHQSKTNYYVSGAYGILSLMKAANTPDMCSLKADDLKTRLKPWIDEVSRTMIKCKEAFERCLDNGVRLSLQEPCESILKGVTEGKNVYHSMLKSLLQNDGIYQKRKKKKSKTKEVNLNERLSKHLRDEVDQEFSKTFPNDQGRPGPIKEAIYNNFTLIDRLIGEHKGVTLQMTFLKTEEDKLKKKLANIIRERKKHIYSSLTKSIQKSMKPCYVQALECSKGKGSFEKMRQAMHAHLKKEQQSTSSMFKKAKKCMLGLVESLKNELEETIRKDMETSIDHSLKTNDNSVPDVTEEYKEVKIIHVGKLKYSSRRSANTGMVSSMEESTDCPSPSPSSLSMKSDKSTHPPINFKTQSPDVSCSEFISNVLYAVQCCRPKCSSKKDLVLNPCGHMYCKHCINTYWAEPSPTGDYVCLTPLCKKSYRDRPELSVNTALSSVLHTAQQTGCPTLAQAGLAWMKKKQKKSIRESEEQQESASKKRKLAGEALVSPASSPVQPQQDKAGDRRPQAEGPFAPTGRNSSCIPKNFFTDHRESLVHKVKKVNSIVGDLRSKGFHEEMDNVQAEGTAQPYMRRILDSMTTVAFEEALYKALLNHEPKLMMELLGTK